PRRLLGDGRLGILSRLLHLGRMGSDVGGGGDLAAAEPEERGATDDQHGNDLQGVEPQGEGSRRILVTAKGDERESGAELEVAEVRGWRRDGEGEIHAEEDGHGCRGAVRKVEGGESGRRGGDLERPGEDGGGKSAEHR